MTGFDLLKRDKGLLFRNNPFSVTCILSNGTEIQGKNSLLDSTDLNYDPTDILKCIGNYIGIQLNTENKTSIINDSSEATLNIDDVKIGRPQAGWTISFVPQNTQETDTNTDMINFKIDYVMEDRTIGVYKLSLSLLKDSLDTETISQTIRTNGGI
ncbi:MAG TPA: hypothetical protein VLL98_00940 [Rickettsiales bacterium]|nr:hypothetical protein [Rickettsiales bacterium]